MVANNNGPVRLLLNETAPTGHWLEIRLQGVKCNRDGIGARVAVFRDSQKPLWGRVHTDGSYLSASDVRVHFGLGQQPDAQVLVEWPDGSKEKWEHVRADSLIQLRQGTGTTPCKGYSGIDVPNVTSRLCVRYSCSYLG